MYPWIHEGNGMKRRPKAITKRPRGFIKPPGPRKFIFKLNTFNQLSQTKLSRFDVVKHCNTLRGRIKTVDIFRPTKCPTRKIHATFYRTSLLNTKIYFFTRVAIKRKRSRIRTMLVINSLIMNSDIFLIHGHPNFYSFDGK